MELSRRDFVKGLGLTTGLVLLSQPSGLGRLDTRVNASSPDVGMLVDVSKCIGCWWCYGACKQYNGLPETIKPNPEEPPGLSPETWSTLFTTKNGAEWRFRKQACMHCTEAACVEVCPTGALSYNSLGFVQYERDKCSGCGYCTEFCPFGVPQLESNKITGAGQMDKCTFCIDRVTEGQQPACAEACPTGAIKFGKRSELVQEGKDRVAELSGTNPQARLYGGEELGGLHVMYVLDNSADSYGLPVSPQLPAATAVRDILQWVGIGGAALVVTGFGLNYLVARARIPKEGKE
ncbi:MAG: 4Fe-4S dicluster domain-containing protein [Dehalococcoidia bacterium]|nr:4Fe-4S dicluster domain-containing protein [Dehalococcoidia bacterium]